MSVAFEPTYETQEGAPTPSHTKARLRRRVYPFGKDDVVEVQGQMTDGRFLCVSESGSAWVHKRNLEAVGEE